MGPMMTDAAKADFLRTVASLATLPAGELEKIASLAAERSVAPGTVIAREGHNTYELILIVSGRAATTGAGAEAGIAGPGSIVGELPSSRGTACGATTTAVTFMHLLILPLDAGSAVPASLRASLAQESCPQQRAPLG